MDQGETENFPAINPSLTFNLGWNRTSRNVTQGQAWRAARRVTLSLSDPESLNAVIWSAAGEQIGAWILARASGEFFCESGRATIRWHVYEAEDVVAAREDYTVEFRRAGDYLLARVRNQGSESSAACCRYGVQPLAGSGSRLCLSSLSRSDPHHSYARLDTR